MPVVDCQGSCSSVISVWKTAENRLWDCSSRAVLGQPLCKIFSLRSPWPGILGIRRRSRMGRHSFSTGLMHNYEMAEFIMYRINISVPRLFWHIHSLRWTLAGVTERPNTQTWITDQVVASRQMTWNGSHRDHTSRDTTRHTP